MSDTMPTVAHNRQEKITVWIIDNNRSFCVVLSEALNRSRSVRCAKTYCACKPAVRDLENEEEKPDIILLDIKMPEMSGLDAIIPIKRAAPATQIIMLTSFDFDRDIQTSIKRGATGYLLKSSTPEDIIRAVEAALRGGAPIDPLVAKRVMRTYVASTPDENVYNLSRREHEIIRCVADGLDTQQLAERLGISGETVRTHVRNIFQKLGVHNRNALIAKAVRERLI